MGELSETQATRVTLTWENAASSGASNLFTGIEASTDLAVWEEVARVPFVTAGTFTVTNDEAFRFFRIYNGVARTNSAWVMLAWDATGDPIVAGYNVYFGAASRNYTNTVDAGTATSCIVSGLAPGATYYFAATSYSASGLESDYSNEATWAPPFLDPPVPITLTINKNEP